MKSSIKGVFETEIYPHMSKLVKKSENNVELFANFFGVDS
jgi:hypothetical protein